ncbi:MAG: flagellar basal body P-ring formation protein FlgA [Bacteroidetes bacterium]|nr:flagellar basal body P-ring formation protein FlgA [Bacteroidota bacterium]
MLVLLLSILFLFNSSGSDIRDDLADYLSIHLKGYEKYEYEILKIPSNYSSIKILNGKDLKLSGNLAYVPVHIVKNNRTAQSYITVKLKLYKNVLVTVRDIKRKEDLAKSDFETSLQNIAGKHAKPFTDIESISSYRSKKNLNEGEILTKNDVEKIPLIKVGDKIKASIVQGNVMIQFDAFSKQEGSAGDIINIVTADNKRFKAKVIDINNVLINE